MMRRSWQLSVWLHELGAHMDVAFKGPEVRLLNISPVSIEGKDVMTTRPEEDNEVFIRKKYGRLLIP